MMKWTHLYIVDKKIKIKLFSPQKVEQTQNEKFITKQDKVWVVWLWSDFAIFQTHFPMNILTLICEWFFHEKKKDENTKIWQQSITATTKNWLKRNDEEESGRFNISFSIFDSLDMPEYWKVKAAYGKWQ